jgi:hypothetical protein
MTFSLGGARMMVRSHLNTVVIVISIVMPMYLNAAFAGIEESHGEAGQKNAAAHILDGKKFKGQTGEKGKKTHHEDVLVFDEGRFTSTECFQFGFMSGPYTATVLSDSIQFEAETLSPTHGKMVWSGILKGDTLDVTYFWTKERWLWTTHREYWFKGTLLRD